MWPWVLWTVLVLAIVKGYGVHGDHADLLMRVSKDESLRFKAKSAINKVFWKAYWSRERTKDTVIVTNYRSVSLKGGHR